MANKSAADFLNRGIGDILKSIHEIEKGGSNPLTGKKFTAEESEQFKKELEKQGVTANIEKIKQTVQDFKEKTQQANGANHQTQ